MFISRKTSSLLSAIILNAKLNKSNTYLSKMEENVSTKLFQWKQDFHVKFNLDGQELVITKMTFLCSYIIHYFLHYIQDVRWSTEIAECTLFINVSIAPSCLLSRCLFFFRFTAVPLFNFSPEL